MKISKEKEEKILEQILLFLFFSSPKAIFTSKIAFEIARDEEYTKKLLLFLKKKKMVKEVFKNSFGKSYLKRRRWTLTDNTYNLYKRIQKRNFG